MTEYREIRIPVELFHVMEQKLKDLGATTVEEYVEAVLRDQLQQAGHLSAYTQQEEEEIERHLRDLGYLD